MADDVHTGTAQPLLLNRYRVEGLLGEGGLGTVIKAFDTRLKSMRAIKTLKRTITTDSEVFRSLEERFTREAEAGSRMGINPVAVYDLVADTGGTLYLILELVPGGTLADRIKQGPLPLADALRITEDAARGLQAAHDVGIVHRDIKPANIFLAADGRAQVGDFGIAQIDDVSARTRTTVGHPGTPLYMSPEQASMTAYMQPATDQYSLGLTLYEMIAGKPYRRSSPQEIAANLAPLPGPVRALIERMAAEQPGERYPSMGAVRTAIETIRRYAPTGDENTRASDAAIVVDAPTIAAPLGAGTRSTPLVNLQPVPPVSPPPPIPVPHTTNRGVLLGVGVLLAVVIVASGAFLAFARRSPSIPVSQTATTAPLVVSGLMATTAAGVVPPTAALATATVPGATVMQPIASAVLPAASVVQPTVVSPTATTAPPVMPGVVGTTAAGVMQPAASMVQPTVVAATATVPVATMQPVASAVLPAASVVQPTVVSPTATTAPPVVPGVVGTTAVAGMVGTPAPPASFAPITSLLSYVDGKVPLPGEPRSNDGMTIIGVPVQVAGVDLSSNEPAKLPAVTAPSGSRVVRTLWAPKGTLLATLVRQPIPGGFSDNLDLVVIDIATGKATTVAKAINAIPAWSPDGTTLVYALSKGLADGVPIDQDGKPLTLNGMPQVVNGMIYDVHLVNADGTKDHVIAHVLPFAQCSGEAELIDPVLNFLDADQFIGAPQQTAWAADNSLIAFSAADATFTFRPDGNNVKQASSCAAPELGTLIGATTDDPYIPANSVQVRLQDDADALRWRYERGLFPTTILTGCNGEPTDNKPCDNMKKGTANAGYRNQIVVRLADGTEKTLTSSPTFKYHIAVSPDGTAVAFTAITMIDYNAAISAFNPSSGSWKTFTGYTTDVYIVRITGGAEQRVSMSGGGHHPSWQRDLPVKIPPRPTPTPTSEATLPPTGKP